MSLARWPSFIRWILNDPIRVWQASCCGAVGKASKTVIVVVEPYPHTHGHKSPYARWDKNFGLLEPFFQTGAGIRLPSDATGLVTGPWHKASELDIKVTEGDSAAIDGVVALSGLSEALESLNVEMCAK